MALLADAVSLSRGCLGWVEYVCGFGCLQVLVRRAVTPVTRNRLGIERWTLVAVHRAWNRSRPTGMTRKALSRGRPREIGVGVSLHARRHPPGLELGVVRNGRLEDRIPYTDEVSERSVPRADHVIDQVRSLVAVSFDPMHHAAVRELHVKRGAGVTVVVNPRRLVRIWLGQRPAHSSA